jgi:biopolymer transport protein TolQ
MQGQLDIWQILLHSGWVVKSVLLMLILSSVLSWTIIVQKWKELKKIKENNELFMQAFQSGGSLSEIFQHTLSQTDSTFGAIFKKGYEEN